MKVVRGREAQGICVSERGSVLAPGPLHLSMPDLRSGQDGGRSGPGSDQGDHRLCQKHQEGMEGVGWRACGWELLLILPGDGPVKALL